MGRSKREFRSSSAFHWQGVSFTFIQYACAIVLTIIFSNLFVSQFGVDVNEAGQDTPLIEKEQSLWQQNSSTEKCNTDGIVSFPFTFSISNSHSSPLPPSFKLQHDDISASVQYYVQVTGIKATWHRMNVRLTRPIIFLPYDDSLSYSGLPSPPSSPRSETASLMGMGKTYKTEMSVRKGSFFGGAGIVRADVGSHLSLAFFNSLTNVHR